MPTRRVFFSFHHQDDVFRVNTIRNVDITNDKKTFHDHAEYEKVMRQDDATIKRWINNQLSGASVTCVMIGANTYGRKWINYEIEKSHELGMGLFGVYIHDLNSIDRSRATKGKNPFSWFSINGTKCDQIFEAYDPSLLTYDRNGSWAHNHITSNIGQWIESAARQANR